MHKAGCWAVVASLLALACDSAEVGTQHHGVLLGTWTVTASSRGAMPSVQCQSTPLPKALTFGSKLTVQYVDGATLDIEWVETKTGFTAGERASVVAGGQKWFLNVVSGTLSQYDTVLTGSIVLDGESGDSCPVSFTAGDD